MASFVGIVQSKREERTQKFLWFAERILIRLNIGFLNTKEETNIDIMVSTFAFC